MSLFLTRTTLREQSGGSREEGLAAAMKDSDEGAAVKHTVDAIYLLMEREHITQTRCLFKFSLCQQEPNKDQAQKAHIYTTMWFHT